MKRLLLVNILSLIVLFGGCNFIGVDTSISWKEEAQKLVSAFDNQDIKLAEKLFAKDVQKNVNLTIQLKKLLSFIIQNQLI